MEELIKKLIAVPEEKWFDNLLKQDLYYRHFSPQQCMELIDKARSAGSQKAAEISAATGFAAQKGAEALANTYHISVRTVCNQEFQMPGEMNFAQYHDREILISQNFLTIMEKYRGLTKPYLGCFSPYEVLVYHEMYHYFEEAEHLENADIKLEVSPFPFLKKKISPDCAGEIAAFEFTRLMAGLNFNPCILEIIVLWEFKQEQALAMLTNLSKPSTDKK